MGFFDFIGRLFGGMPERRGAREPVRKRTREIVLKRCDPNRLRLLGLPVIEDTASLASQMGITVGELTWLADPERRAAESRPHYHPLVRRKRDGRIRVVLAPRKKLKAAQRWILRNILDKLPASQQAHGFVRRRSIRTNAAPHVSREIVMQLDVRDFFHQFTLRQVRRLFRSFGYSSQVADRLALLTTAPIRQMLPALSERSGEKSLADAFRRARTGALHPMLPQGAPTSPALANLFCRRLDARFEGLARRFRAGYTRYADDLTFSGGDEFRRDMRRFVPLVRKVLASERLSLAPGKLRFARKGGRQNVTGLVVNRKVNVRAEEIRTLRAILHNCRTHGPEKQNRKGHADFPAHLRGRIAFVRSVNPAQGARLQAAFEAVAW